MAAERRDEMVRQERNEEQEGEFPLKNRGPIIQLSSNGGYVFCVFCALFVRKTLFDFDCCTSD